MRNRSIGRRAARILVIVMIAVGGLTATATPSMAATCNWSSCNDKDPQATGCSASVTVMDSYYYWAGSVGEYTIELRRGNNCTAMWTRVTRGDCWGDYKFYVAIEEDHVPTPYGYYTAIEGTASNPAATCDGGKVWSYMRQYDHNTGSRYRMCWERRPYNDPAPGRYQHLVNCTAWKSY